MSEIGRIILINKKGNDGAFLPIPRNSEQDIIIGKCATADIRIQNEAISDEHCSICYNGHKAIIRNLTKAVTFVNNVSLNKLGQQVVLKHNDLIKIEDRTFRWEYLQDVALSGKSKGTVIKGRVSEPPIKTTGGRVKNQSPVLSSPVFKRRSLMLKKQAASTSLSKDKSNASLRKINKTPGLNHSHLNSAAKLRNPNILRVMQQGLLPSPSPGDDAGGEVNKVSGVLSPKKPTSSPAPGPSIGRLNGKSATSPRRNVASPKQNSPQVSKSAGKDATNSSKLRVSSNKRRSQPAQSPKLSRAKRKLNLNEHSGELGDSLTSISKSSLSDDPHEFFSISNSEPSLYEDSVFSPPSGSSPAQSLFHSTALSKSPSVGSSLKNRSPNNRTIINGSLSSPNNRSRSLLSKTVSPRQVNVAGTSGTRRSRPSRSPEFESTLTFWENLTDNDLGGSRKKSTVANGGSPNKSRKNASLVNGSSRRSQTFSLSNITDVSSHNIGQGGTPSRSALSVTPLNRSPNSWLTSVGPDSSVHTKSARKSSKSASTTRGDDTASASFSSSFYSPQHLALATEDNAIFTPYTCEISPRSRVGSPRSQNTTPSVLPGGRKSDDLIYVCNKVTADQIEKALSAPAALEKTLRNSSQVASFNTSSTSVQSFTPSPVKHNASTRQSPATSLRLSGTPATPSPTRSSTRSEPPVSSVTQSATPQSVAKKPASLKKNTPTKATLQSAVKKTPTSSKKDTSAKNTPSSVSKKTPSSSRKNTPITTPASSKKNTPVKSAPKKTPTSSKKNTPAKRTPQSVAKKTPASLKKNTPTKATLQSAVKKTPTSAKKDTSAKSTPSSVSKKTPASSRKNTPITTPASSKKNTPVKSALKKTPTSSKKNTPAKRTPQSVSKNTPGKTKRITPKNANKKTPVVSKKTPAKKSTPAKSTEKALFSGNRSVSSPLVVFNLVTPEELPQIGIPGDEPEVVPPQKGSAKKGAKAATPFSVSRKNTSSLVVFNLVTPEELPKIATPSRAPKTATPETCSSKIAAESPTPFSASRRGKKSPLVVYNLVTPDHVADAEAICHEADEIISPTKSPNTSSTGPNGAFTAPRKSTSPLVVYNLVTADYATPAQDEEEETPSSTKRGRSLAKSPKTPPKELAVLNASRSSPLVVYNLVTPRQVDASPAGKQTTAGSARKTTTPARNRSSSKATPAKISATRSSSVPSSSKKGTSAKTSATRSSSVPSSAKKGTTPITLKAIGPSSSGKKSSQRKKATPKSSTKASETAARSSVTAVKKALRFSALPSPAAKSPKTPSTKPVEDSVVLLSATKRSARKRKLAETIDLALERSEFPSPDDFSLHPLSSAKLGKFSRSGSGTFSGTFPSPSLLGRRSSAHRSGVLSPRLSTPHPRKTTTRVSFDPKLDKGSPGPAAASKSRKSSLKTVFESSRHSFGSDSSLNYSDVSDLGRKRKGFTSTPMPPRAQGLHSILKVVSKESFDGSHLSAHSDKSLRYTSRASTTFGEFDSPQITRDIFVSPLNESTTSRRSVNVSRSSSRRSSKSPSNRTPSPSHVIESPGASKAPGSTEELQHSLVHSTSSSPNLNHIYSMSTLSGKNPTSARQSVNLKQYTNFLLARSPNQGYDRNLSGVGSLFATQPTTPPQSPTVDSTVDSTEQITATNKKNAAATRNSEAVLSSPVAARQTRKRNTAVDTKPAPKKKPSKATKVIESPVEVKVTMPPPAKKTRRNAPASPAPVSAKKRKEESPVVKPAAGIVKKSSRLNPSLESSPPAIAKKSARSTKSNRAVSSAPTSRVVTPKTRRGGRDRAKSNETVVPAPAITQQASDDLKIVGKASKRKTRAAGPNVHTEEKGPTPPKRARSNTPTATPVKTRRGRTRGDSTKENTPVKSSPKRTSKAITKAGPKASKNSGKGPVKDSPIASPVKSKKSAVKKVSTPAQDLPSGQGRATRRKAAPLAASSAAGSSKRKQKPATTKVTPAKETTPAKQTNIRGGKKTTQVKKSSTPSSPVIAPVRATRSRKAAAAVETKSPVPATRRKKAASLAASVPAKSKTTKKESPVAKKSTKATVTKRKTTEKRPSLVVRKTSSPRITRTRSGAKK